MKRIIRFFCNFIFFPLFLLFLLRPVGEEFGFIESDEPSRRQETSIKEFKLVDPPEFNYPIGGWLMKFPPGSIELILFAPLPMCALFLHYRFPSSLWRWILHYSTTLQARAISTPFVYRTLQIPCVNSVHSFLHQFFFARRASRPARPRAACYLNYILHRPDARNVCGLIL